MSGLSISKVDCTQNKMTCDKYEVKGYPTLLYFRLLGLGLTLLNSLIPGMER